jgi:hypothetical protein
MWRRTGFASVEHAPHLLKQRAKPSLLRLGVLYRYPSTLRPKE